MRSKSAFTVISLLIISAFVLSACAGATGGGTIKIGLNIEVTGDLPKVGEQSQQAAEMYVEENPTVTIGGNDYDIELVVEDNNATAEGAAAAANKLITQDNIHVMIGPNPSSAAVPAGEVANNLETPMISPWSTNPNTTLDRPWVFRVPFLDPFQGPVLANFATDEFGVDKACVLFDVASDYPKGLADNFRSAWENLHGEGSVVAFESFTTGDQDFSAQLTKIIGADCGVLFTPQYYQEVPLIVSQAQELGIDIPILGSDSWGDPQTIELCGPACNGYYFSTHYVASGATGATKDFIDAYTAKYGDVPGDVAALTWDAMLLVVQALENCGEISGDLAQDRTCIRDGLAEIENFEGITGNMTFDEQGDPVKCAVIVQIVNEEFQAYKSACP